MSTYSVPSGRGYMDITLESTENKSLKSIQAFQMEESLNIDLEFDDHSRLEIIFHLGFRASTKLLDQDEGDYRVRRKLKPKRQPQ